MLDLHITGAFGTTNLSVIIYEQSHILVVAPRVFKLDLCLCHYGHFLLQPYFIFPSSTASQ